jgi:hypothetical protein
MLLKLITMLPSDFIVTVTPLRDPKSAYVQLKRIFATSFYNRKDPTIYHRTAVFKICIGCAFSQLGWIVHPSRSGRFGSLITRPARGKHSADRR